MTLASLTANNMSAAIEISNYKDRVERARDAAQVAFERSLKEDRELQARIAKTVDDKTPADTVDALDRTWRCLQEQIKYYAGMVAGYNGALMLLYAA